MAPSRAAADPNHKPAAAAHVSVPAAHQARDTLYVLFAWRCINAYFCRTFFQPDEYFQALEPAWQLVFGPDSGAWLTWEWKYGLRSSLHPAIFAIGYALVDNSIGDLYTVKAKWLVAVPRIMQAGFAALGDWYSWRLAGKLFGRGTPVSWAVLAMAMLNPWSWYTATRTFSNCLEATLTSVALFYWPWELLGVQKLGDDKTEESEAAPLATSKQVNSLRISLLLAALAVLLRPTNALLWFAIGTLMLTRATLDGESPLSTKNFLILVREAVLCGSTAIGMALLADRMYFGEWTSTAANLVHFNVAQDLASFYGENDWHYYLSQGIPLLCNTFAPFVLQGLWKSTSSSDGGADVARPVTTTNALKALSFAALTSIASLSLISHKEVRFIMPLVPIFHVIAAPYITSFFTNAKAAASMCPPPALQWKRRPLLALGLTLNMIVAIYVSYFHSAGPNLVMSFLRNEFQELHPDKLIIEMNSNRTIAAMTAGDVEDGSAPVASSSIQGSEELFALFLTPCHATPWRSHLAYPSLHARGLTCEPPVHTTPGSSERAGYEEEASRFFADPVAYFDNELWPSPASPSSSSYPTEDRELPMARYIIAYDGLEDILLRYFDRESGAGRRHNVTLRKVWSVWNGVFTDDDRKAGNLVVWATGVYDTADEQRGIVRPKMMGKDDGSSCDGGSSAKKDS